jgi:hypothetical protein
VASSLLSGLSAYVDIGLVLLWMYTSVPVSSSIFTMSFAVVLGLISTFVIRTKVCSSLGDNSFLIDMTAAWSHGVYTYILLFVHLNVVPKIAPKDEPDLWRSTFFS